MFAEQEDAVLALGANMSMKIDNINIMPLNIRNVPTRRMTSTLGEIPSCRDIQISGTLMRSLWWSSSNDQHFQSCPVNPAGIGWVNHGIKLKTIIDLCIC